jgi:uncharacterized membrane protein
LADTGEMHASDSPTPSQSRETAEVPTLPAPPRPITPAARARSWHEKSVRVWVGISLIVLFVLIYFVVSQVRASLVERELIVSGTSREVTIERVNGMSDSSIRWSRAEPLTIQFSLDPPGMAERRMITGQIRRIESVSGLAPTIKVGDRLQIRSDPNNPSNFTDRLEPTPWVNSLFTSVLIAPVLFIVIVIALLQRRSVLKVWKLGSVREAIVVDHKQTALAPRQMLLRYALADGDGRVYTMLYPTAAGVPQDGESFWVVTPDDAPSRAIVAKLYD